jgi:ankyrin repeat protein
LRLKRIVDPRLRDAAMSLALIDDDSRMTTALLKAGADPNLRDHDGFTLLIMAVRYEAPGSAKALGIAPM